MKVLLVATVQSHICQFHRPLVAMLHEHGCEVHVAARNNLAEKNGLKLDFVEQIFDVPFRRAPFSPKNLAAYRKLRRLIDTGDYDVIHCNTPVGGVVGRLAARRARKRGAKVLYTAHGFHFYRGAGKMSWLVWYPVERFMCRFTDTLLTVVEEDYAFARKKLPTHIARIHGVGADSEKYRPQSDAQRAALRHALGCGEKDKLLLCTGELRLNKNQRTAVLALKKLSETHPEARLMLAGNGAALSELQTLAQTLGVQDRLLFLGYHTDLERYADLAEVIVSCSLREGLPMNIVEGMLLAKPVVASDNRGHRELITPDVTGYLAPPTDADAFARYLALLLDHPETAAELGRRGHRRALAYTDAAVMEELAQIYGFAAPGGGSTWDSYGEC